jgi:hypothetical protein
VVLAEIGSLGPNDPAVQAVQQSQGMYMTDRIETQVLDAAGESN